MTSFASPRFPLVLALALSALALPLAAAAAPDAVFAAAGPSAWQDGAWLPLPVAPAVEAEAAGASTAPFRTAAAAATANEGSEVQDFFPLIESDGSVDVALFVAVVDKDSCLWRTDGTAAGTFRLSPAGECVPLRNDFPFVGAADGVAYFVAGHFPFRYWRTDGTAAGTWPLMDFFDPSLWGFRFQFIAAPPLDIVLFVANDGVHGREIWVSDGSAESARRLGDVPGLDRSPFRFQVLGSEILFFVNRDGFVYELWKTDGTAAGTTMVEAVGSEQFYAGPSSIYPVDGGVIFFLSGAGRCWVELWRSDGTAAGTEPIRGFVGTSCPSSGGQFQATLVEGFGTDRFFATDDGVHGVELWRTDGTPGGTFAVTDLAPEQPFPRGFPLNPRPVGYAGEIYFAADDGAHGMELWKSDGTPGGAELVADICPGACSSDPGQLSAVGGHLVFSAQTPASGRELWVSDGTAAGTGRVTDLCPGACGASISRVVVFGDSLLFIADDGNHGEEWWIFAPPAGPAVRVTDLAPASPFGLFRTMLPLGDRAVFAADDGLHGREPWATDGTPQGTHLLVDLEKAEIPPPPEPPPPPANLVAEHLGGGHVRFSWEDRSTDEQGFLVEVLEPGAADWRILFGVGPDVTVREEFVGSGSFLFRARTTRFGVESEPSNEVALTIGGFCEPSDTVLCLAGNRFRVTVVWQNQHALPPNTGQGRAVPAGDGIDDSGYFWFFTPDNLELVVKVLDGTPVNGRFWVFWGALTDVGYTIQVEDMSSTGHIAQYHNPPGQICGGADTAFPSGGNGGFARTGATAGPPRAAAPPAAPFSVASGPATRFLALDAPASATGALHPPQPCVPDEETLCLLDGMLAVTVDWRDQHNGGSGVGRARPYTDITGFFWFFHPENIELVVKALDGRTVNGKIWVFYGALTDVGYTIRVENHRADGHAVRTYTNPPGTICGQGDTAAF